MLTDVVHICSHLWKRFMLSGDRIFGYLSWYQRILLLFNLKLVNVWAHYNSFYIFSLENDWLLLNKLCDWNHRKIRLYVVYRTSLLNQVELMSIAVQLSVNFANVQPNNMSLTPLRTSVTHISDWLDATRTRIGIDETTQRI